MVLLPCPTCRECLGIPISFATCPMWGTMWHEKDDTLERIPTWNAMRTVACHFSDSNLSDDIIDLKMEVEVVRCHSVPMMGCETLWSRVCGVDPYRCMEFCTVHRVDRY